MFVVCEFKIGCNLCTYDLANCHDWDDQSKIVHLAIKKFVVHNVFGIFKSMEILTKHQIIYDEIETLTII